MATFASPEPADCVELCEPYPAVLPYWNWYVVGTPCGSIVPVTIAPLEVAPLAEPVETLGAGVAVVANVSSTPSTVPALLTATRRKW